MRATHAEVRTTPPIDSSQEHSTLARSPWSAARAFSGLLRSARASRSRPGSLRSGGYRSVALDPTWRWRARTSGRSPCEAGQWAPPLDDDACRCHRTISQHRQVPGTDCAPWSRRQTEACLVAGAETTARRPCHCRVRSSHCHKVLATTSQSRIISFRTCTEASREDTPATKVFARFAGVALITGVVSSRPLPNTRSGHSHFPPTRINTQLRRCVPTSRTFHCDLSICQCNTGTTDTRSSPPGAPSAAAVMEPHDGKPASSTLRRSRTSTDVNGQRSTRIKGALSRAALGTRFCLFGGEIYVLSSFFIVLDLVNPWPSDLETSTDAFLFTWASWKYLFFKFFVSFAKMTWVTVKFRPTLHSRFQRLVQPVALGASSSSWTTS